MKIKRQNCKIIYNYNKQLRDKHEDVKYDIKNKMWGMGVKNVYLLECVWT